MNGLPLDSIEANVERAHGNVDGANKQLSDTTILDSIKWNNYCWNY